MLNRMNAGDRALVSLMDSAVDNLRDGEDAYEIAISMLGLIGGDVLTESNSGGTAFQLWAEISDLLDAPEGPQSREMCTAAVQRVAENWKPVNKASRAAVHRFFTKMVADIS